LKDACEKLRKLEIITPDEIQGCQLSRFRRKLPDFYARFRFFDFFFKLGFSESLIKTFLALHSLVQKTRTEAISCMSNATLESLIQKITAVHDGSCHSQHFPTEVIRNAKSATKLSLTSAVSSSTAINSTDSVD
jgi:hypothetical protein